MREAIPRWVLPGTLTYTGAKGVQHANIIYFSEVCSCSFGFGPLSMAIGTILDLSRQPDMPSVVTLRGLIARHPDFPIVERGKRGRGYRIDLDAAARFVTGLKAPKKISPIERRELIRALGLEFALRDHEGIENVDCSE